MRSADDGLQGEASKRSGLLVEFRRLKAPASISFEKSMVSRALYSNELMTMVLVCFAGTLLSTEAPDPTNNRPLNVASAELVPDLLKAGKVFFGHSWRDGSCL